MSCYFLVEFFISLTNRIIIYNMEERIFHGNLTPADLARALHAAFNRSNLYAQTMGKGDKLAVQISSRPHARSGILHFAAV